MSSVSCVVSAYFAAKYLDGRLENLQAQKPAPEIVVVCQEGSAEHKIALKYKGVKLVLTPDIPTVYDAWNQGITHASGDYVTNQNSDDRLYPMALAKLARALDEHPEAAVAYSNADVVEEIGGKITSRYEWAEGGLEELVNMGCFLGPWPMWRKSLHDHYGLFDGEMHSAGDYEFWMRLASGGETFYHVNEVTGAYLNRPDSAEHRLKLRSTWEQARARARYRAGVKLWAKPEVMTEA
jgi:glycosyltransferase involved in cell wall biosynthesis